MPTATITQVLDYTPFGAAEKSVIKIIPIPYETESTGTVTFKAGTTSPFSLDVPMEPTSFPMSIRLYNRGTVEVAIELTQGITVSLLPSLPPYSMLEYAQPANVPVEPITAITLGLTDDAMADCSIDYLILYTAMPHGAPM